MAVFDSVIDLVGATPSVRLRRLTAGLAPQIQVKLEFANPGGSVKDRAALSMIRAAEADGSLRPGGTIVETTSGNTGIGLAFVGAHLGYRTVIFTSGQIAREKLAALRAYGAEVRLVEGYFPRGHPQSLAAVAEAFAAETPGAWRANQYDNPANPAAHARSTGPEIWADTGGRVTHLVATAGTGGTITGTGEALKRLSGGRVRVVAADPEFSRYGGGDGSPKHIEGAGHGAHPDAAEDVWPQSFHTDVVDEYVRVSDAESIAVARRAAREEGLLIGGSAGTALAAALRLAERLGEEDLIVVIAPDSGRNALSTYFDDDWLADRGFAAAPADADVPRVADLLDGPAPRVGKDLTVAQALEALRAQGREADTPVLVAYVRDGDPAAPIPPGEVLGVTTPRRLEVAQRRGRGAQPVTAHAASAPPVVGAGRSVREALESAGAAPVGVDALSVLAEGRIVGLVSRAAIAAWADEPAVAP